MELIEKIEVVYLKRMGIFSLQFILPNDGFVLFDATETSYCFLILHNKWKLMFSVQK